MRCNSGRSRTKKRTRRGRPFPAFIAVRVPPVAETNGSGLRGLSRDRLRELFGERLERPAVPSSQREVREEPRHHDAGAEVAEPGLGPLPAGERKRELRVA